MAVAVSIEPFSPTLDMYDAPDSSSAYSLSGHIVISLTPASSLLGLARPAPQNLILTSLELTFEGQSELVLNDIGYSPLRLISLTKELVSEHVPISVDDDDRAEWRLVFDLPIPGWLPATSVFGDDAQQPAGVSYALYARARFLTASPDLDDVPSTSVWNNLCAAVSLAYNRPRYVDAERVPIALTRYVSLPHDAADFPRCAYAIQVADTTTTTNIPLDILRTLQVHAIVPSRTSVADCSVPLVLRMRSPADGLRVLGFEADVVQIEDFRTCPSPSYNACFPLPPPAEQPPAKPLNAPHPVSALFELGFVALPTPHTHVIRERSLAPAGATKLFRVRGADTAAHTPGVALEDAWLRMEGALPVMPARAAGDNGPLLSVSHEVRVRLAVGCDGAPTSDELVFSVPLEFVRVAPVPDAPSPVRATPSPALPAYSQLFHENGDRKEDGALPLYREKEDAAEASSSDESDAEALFSQGDPEVHTDSDLDTEAGSSTSSSSEVHTDSDSDAPRTPPGLSRRKRRGESFLLLDDEDAEEVQYGIAL